MTSVLVQSLGDYAHAHLVTTGHHAFVVDEPPDDGGNGLGPTPYELLAAALGACTSMTLQMYARRQGYPLLEAAVEVTHHKRYARDRDGAGAEHGAMIETLERKIVLRGPLTDEQRDDLLQIANRCPVHRTLQHLPAVTDTIEVVA